MERSQYLAQALQSMGSDASMQPQVQAPDLAQMQKVAEARKAFETANPGQSYMAHGVRQMGQNIMAAPGNAMSGLGDLAQRLGVR